MSKLVVGLTVVFVAGLLTTPVLAAGRKTTTASSDDSSGAPTTKEEKQKLAEHMKMRHAIEKTAKYPATKDELSATMKKSGIKQGDRDWFDQTLPTGTYDTSADVEKALGWPNDPATATAGGDTTAPSQTSKTGKK